MTHLYKSFVSGILLLVAVAGLCPAAAAAAGLNLADCGKCHPFQSKMVHEKGGKHATEVVCLDCHRQHPPQGKDTIADCSDCHSEQPHYRIGNCQQCHADPHQPLVMLRDPLKPARKECLSCHQQVGGQMSAAPSRHADLFCNRCHSHHKEIPGCLDCHTAHQRSQTASDCLNCHPAHQPLQIVPTGYVPAKFCRPCHIPQSNELAATTSNHGGISCVSCHKGLHPDIPKCQDCHALPHSRAIHSQFRECLACHGDAHRLISR